MNDLQSCPFCGETASLIPIMSLSKEKNIECYFVMCDECYAQTGDFSTKEEAIKAWNKRV